MNEFKISYIPELIEHTVKGPNGPEKHKYSVTFNQSTIEDRLDYFNLYRPCIALDNAPIGKHLFESGNFAECRLDDNLIGLCNFSIDYDAEEHSLIMGINAISMTTEFTVPFKKKSKTWEAEWMESYYNYEYWFSISLATIINKVLSQYEPEQLPKVYLDCDIDSLRESNWVEFVFAHIQSHFEWMDGDVEKCEFIAGW